MLFSKSKIRDLFRLKLRFAMTSAIATAFDYILYLILVDRFFAPPVAYTIAYSLSILLNFYLQKRFVFSLNRKLSAAFGLAILVSLGGMVLGLGILGGLNQWPFLRSRQYLAKLITTGIVFFYNFYFKRFAFEKTLYAKRINQVLALVKNHKNDSKILYYSPTGPSPISAIYDASTIC